MKYKLITPIFLLLIIGTFSCKKTSTIIPNEEEVITTLNYTLVPVGGGSTVTLIYKDLDGDGGNAPVITGGTLDVNKTYNGTIELLNEQNVPADDITAEVSAEAKDHQFFFQSTLTGLSVAYTDQDSDGNPLGIKTSLTTTSAGMGNLTIVLRHEPSKTASGVSTGNITNAGGETDIEVTFDLDVQ